MINGNESELISVISGTFEYNGQTYVASKEYLNQAIAYLDQDDVDCTDEQKSKALSQIYGSVAEGVSEGYLVPATGSGNANQVTKPENSQVTNEPEESDEVKPVSENADSTSESADPTSETETTAQSDYEKLSAKEKKEQADALLKEYNRTHNPMVSALENIGSSDGLEISATTESISVDNIKLPTEMIKNVQGTLVFILLITLVCIFFNKRLRKDGQHKKARHNRHILSWVSVLSLSTASFIMLCVASIRLGYYRQATLSEAFTQTKYYELNCDACITEIRAYTGAIGIPSSVLDTGNIETWYNLEMRKTVLKNNEEGYFEKSVIKNVQKPINDYLNSQDIELTQRATEGLANMLFGLVEDFKKGLSIPGLDIWYAQKASVSAYFTDEIFIYLFIFALCFFALFTVQTHKKHIIGYLGASGLLTGIMGLALLAVSAHFGRELVNRILSTNAGEITTFMLKRSGLVLFAGTILIMVAGILFLAIDRKIKNEESFS